MVLDRSVYSDFVFVEAMFSKGYLSRGGIYLILTDRYINVFSDYLLARSLYYEIRNNSIGELIRPHLVIYLDVPTNKILENIQKRNISYEKNSPVLTTDYLAVMEKYYKQDFLKEMSKETELLVYDWSSEGDADVVVEDVERINFERGDIQDPKFKDWRYFQEEAFAILRNK